MRFVEQLFLIQTRGLAAEAVHRLVCGGRLLERGSLPERGLPWDVETQEGRSRLELALQAEGQLRGRAIAWPSPESVGRLAKLLRRAGARLAWRGAADYPGKLAARLGDAAPAWVWLAGSEERLAGPTCAMIGSRQTPPELLGAARRLARALAGAGVAVVSGMATGADTAAHEGARAGRAGTVAVPAMGLLTAGLPVPLKKSSCEYPAKAGTPEQTSWLGLDWPDAPFSAGLAIRRNDVIAALGDALVLVASGLRGGSSYGVRWALRNGSPLFCFDAGADTPPANRALIRARQARALKVNDPPEAWLEIILPKIEKRHSSNVKSGISQPTFSFE